MKLEPFQEGVLGGELFPVLVIVKLHKLHHYAPDE
jgi:hypothetical protein